ncbi:MAG TPA: DinB family protein [Flavisolibacter sp.]|jgi:hypothetical protein|nr:DinB family protein [Flavisolibacter sp.]
MNAEKVDFLHYKLVPLLQKISTDTKPAWGKMTLQQMIEHIAYSMRIASGKIMFAEVITPPEHLERLRDFLLSEKPFKENTPNALLPETPAPVKNPSIEEALKELKDEICTFFSVFEKDSLQVTRNPFFGDLNFEQNVHLLYKHALHHLRQFNTNP